jgi:hypothetical protein
VNGTTTVVAAPTGGLLSGMGCVMNLDGWTWEEMVIKTPIGVFMNFPTPSATPNQSADARRRDWESRMRPLNEFFDDARRYLRAHQAAGKDGIPAHERDPRFDAMIPILEGKLPLFVRVNSALGIQAAIRWAEEQKGAPCDSGRLGGVEGRRPAAREASARDSGRRPQHAQRRIGAV